MLTIQERARYATSAVLVLSVSGHIWLPISGPMLTALAFRSALAPIYQRYLGEGRSGWRRSSRLASRLGHSLLWLSKATVFWWHWLSAMITQLTTSSWT